MSECSNHDQSDKPGQYFGDVMHRFAYPDFYFIVGYIEGIPAQFIDADFERYPRSQRRFGENAGGRFSGQRLGRDFPAFHLAAQFEDFENFFAAQVGYFAQ